LPEKANVNNTADDILKVFKELRLGGMTDEFKAQNNDLGTYGAMSFSERLLKICMAEKEKRDRNSLAARLKEAKLINPMACLENVVVDANRTLNMELLTSLATCKFISQKRHISLEGATGTGKSYLASAIGNAACRNHFKVRCVRLPDLLNELLVARRQGETNIVRDSYLKYDLMIFDDFLLMPITVDYTFELLDIINACLGKCSMIFCSQYPNTEWYQRIDSDRTAGSDSTLAEAVLDRIIHHMDVITISSKQSMRSFYDPSGEPSKK